MPPRTALLTAVCCSSCSTCLPAVIVDGDIEKACEELATFGQIHGWPVTKQFAVAEELQALVPDRPFAVYSALSDALKDVFTGKLVPADQDMQDADTSGEQQPIAT